MVAKRVSARKKTTKRKATKHPAPELTDSAVLVVLESTESSPPGASPIDPDVRRELIAAEAYFMAERRGFAAGHELEDWVAAEAAVESRLRQMQAA
jgi:hypothetical protein